MTDHHRDKRKGVYNMKINKSLFFFGLLDLIIYRTFCIENKQLHLDLFVMPYLQSLTPNLIHIPDVLERFHSTDLILERK